MECLPDKICKGILREFSVILIRHASFVAGCEKADGSSSPERKSSQLFKDLDFL
jgi:hypothetical protein